MLGWAVLISSLLLAGGLPASASRSDPLVQPSPTTTPTIRDPWIRLDQAPEALAPSGADTLTVTVVAGAREIPAGWSVMLTMQPRLLSNRTAVREWRSGSLEGAVGQEVSRLTLSEAIAPGAEHQLQLTIPEAAKTRLANPAIWGVHGAAVLLLDDDNDTRRALTRTFLISGTPPPIPEPPRISVLLPITATSISPQTGLAARSTLAELQPGGRLDELADLAGQAGVITLLDPAVLTLSPDPDAPPAEGLEEPLAQWRDKLAGRLSDRDVIGLPYADPDMVALQLAGEKDLARLADSMGRQAFSEAGLHPRQNIAAPAAGQTDIDTLQWYSETGRGAAAVLDAAEQLPVGPSRVTPSGRGAVETQDGTFQTILSDPSLSTALAATGTRGPSGGAAALQRIRADLVVLAGEAPFRERHIVVSAPRDLMPTQASHDALDVLLNRGLSRPDSLTHLLDSGPVDREAPSLTAGQRQAALPSAGVTEVNRTLTEATGLASTFTEADAGVDRMNRIAIGLVSSRWRSDPNRWSSAREQYASAVSQLREAVHVVPGSTVTQVSRNVRLPVTVENATAGDVTVTVHVTPASTRLIVPESLEVTVPAHSRATSYVPVRGVGNGNTTVEISLVAPSGVQLGSPVITNVRVRADWETVGTRWMAGFAALVLVVGLVRSVRRGSRASRARDPLRTEPASDDDPAPGSTLADVRGEG